MTYGHGVMLIWLFMCSWIRVLCLDSLRKVGNTWTVSTNIDRKSFSFLKLHFFFFFKNDKFIRKRKNSAISSRTFLQMAENEV